MYRVRGADDKEYGPVSVEQIQQWIRERRLNAQSLIMTEGTVGWKPLSTFPEFTDLMSAQAPVPPAPAEAPTAPMASAEYLPPGVELPRKTNTFALVGLIMGCVSVLLSCCCYGIPFNILGLVFSILGLSQIKRNMPPEKGKEMAIAGIILSVLSFIIAILIVILVGAMNLPDMMKKMKLNL